MHNNYAKRTVCAQFLCIGIKGLDYDEWFTDINRNALAQHHTHTPAVVACVTTVVSVTVMLLVAFTEMV